jgi:hypothetical protein
LAGAIARGDLVIVHSNSHGLHGLFQVDAVNVNAITIAEPGHPGLVKGGYKGSFPTIDAADIHAVYPAVYKAASLSA